jgi:hypothetical protein
MVAKAPKDSATAEEWPEETCCPYPYKSLGALSDGSGNFVIPVSEHTGQCSTRMTIIFT